MTFSTKSIAFAVSTVLALAQISTAASPPNVVQSDGNGNTAMGGGALYHLTSGNQNTAAGDGALTSNTEGSDSVAFGYLALANNTSGSANSAFGIQALHYNVSGGYNTAIGGASMEANINGYYNTALGSSTLEKNTSGSNNTAVGEEALVFNTTGSSNTAAGFLASYNNTTGSNNTAIGLYALDMNTTGSNNIAFGNSAGVNLTTGSNNIDLGAGGKAGESNAIRIGTPGTQKTAYIAGIESSKVTGAAVYVTTSGQLGVLASSERYKTRINTMTTDADKIARLRPVTFHLKSEPKGQVQYGLIAEEVKEVYPELVIRDAAGVIQGVRYDELSPLLLKRVQDQDVELREQARKQRDQDARQNRLEAQLAVVIKQNEEMKAAMAMMQPATQQVAMR